DRKTDPAVYSPSSGDWYVLTNPPRVAQWGGGATDIPVPADYDGDGKTDYAVWRSQMWHIKYSSTGGDAAIPFDVGGGQPVPADFDGDGKTDLAVYKAWLSEWWVRKSSDGSTVLLAVFGGQLDETVPRK
ncbi:MAG TPA: VCBS repeat-containing protein, partial [Pyrinomonadaceae bacterium]|nr:VCBS repeat-containing protein [Pyrinomonadaceae bacterium]